MCGSLMENVKLFLNKTLNAFSVQISHLMQKYLKLLPLLLTDKLVLHDSLIKILVLFILGSPWHGIFLAQALDFLCDLFPFVSMLLDIISVLQHLSICSAIVGWVGIRVIPYNRES